jgi:periplasmic protein TonB
MTLALAADTRRELQRWALCGAIVLAAHGGFAAAMVHWRDVDEPDDPAAAIVIDLAPMPVAPPSPPTETPPGPEQVQAEAAPQKPVEKVEEPEEKVEETKEAREKEPEVAPAVDPEVVMAAAPPKKDPEPPTPADTQPPAPVTTAPQVPAAVEGPVAAAPTQGKPSVSNSNAIPAWKRQVVGLLERNKRYPAAAKGAEGTAQLTFSLDRQGRVVASRILKSSGNSVLDAEALEWVKRAQPFPPPPSDMLKADKVDLSVPYKFNAR